MAKLLRSKKRFGRCKVPGHNISNCEMCREIQSTEISRAQDRRDAAKEIAEQIKAATSGRYV